MESGVCYRMFGFRNVLVPLVLANSALLHRVYATTGEDHRLAPHLSWFYVCQCCRRTYKCYEAACVVYVRHFKCSSHRLSSKFVNTVLQMALVIRICCPCVFATRNISLSVPTSLQWNRQESSHKLLFVKVKRVQELLVYLNH